MASTADIIKGAVQSAAAGKQVNSDTVESGSESISEASFNDEQYVTAMESSPEDLLPSSEDTPTDSTESENQPLAGKKSEANQKTSGDKEVITVTDEKGRRKIEIDWNDKEKLKKDLQLAHGSRKWQAERDQAIQARKAVETELKETKDNWTLMNKVFEEQGEEGLIDLLRGRKGAYKEQINRQIERARFLEKASPEEIEALEAREASQRQGKEIERIRKENEEFKKQVQQEREAAELRSLESRVHPVFDKYRFADKLGNSDDEHMFDEMLWNSALKRLEPYEEKGLDITPELVEREFRSVASAIRRRVGVQAEKKASAAIEQKKQEATENVQAKVMSGYKTGGAAKEARDLINSNNLTGLLKNWGKYGGLFRK